MNTNVPPYLLAEPLTSTKQALLTWVFAHHTDRQPPVQCSSLRTDRRSQASGFDKVSRGRS